MERALSWRDLAILGVTGGPIFAALTFGLSPPKALAVERPDCSGAALTIGSIDPPFIGGPAIVHAESWQADTGGTADVVTFPFEELYDAYMSRLADRADERFDVILHPPAWHGDFAPFLTEIPADLKSGIVWEDIHPTYRERLMLWNGRHISVTIDGDVHTGNYRTDLFEDDLNRSAFRERYGYDLTAPNTWDQFGDIAEFFTRPGDELYGNVEAYARGGQQFWFLFSHAAAFTNHPDHPGSMFFDPETMHAQIDNPGWLKGLQNYIRSLGHAAPNAINFDSTDNRTQFVSGHAAMNIGWGDTGTMAADPKFRVWGVDEAGELEFGQSQVVGNVGFFMLPGSREIWNHKTGQWDRFAQVIHSPFMAFGGWVASVPAGTADLLCAWDYVMWLAGIERSAHDVVTGGTGINPYRVSHFENPELWSKVFDSETAQRYLSVQRASIEAPNVALDFRIPGYFRYTEALEIELTKALSGQVTPEAALDAVAVEWNRITDDLGRAEQLAAYRSSMGLPPIE